MYLRGDPPEISMVFSLAFGRNENQMCDSLPQILHHQERDACLCPSPSQQDKGPTKRKFSNPDS